MPEVAAFPIREALKRIPLLTPLVRAGRVIFDPATRSTWMLRHFGPGLFFQPSNVTMLNRYPEFFAFTRDRLMNQSDVRILSFGCATGEEVFSLSKYLPEADILGIDINPLNIAECRRRFAKNPNPRLSVKRANSTADEEPESFDAIFCMAVLRHGELVATIPERCDHLIRFEDFDHIVRGFEHCLKPGGYLALRHCHFRFAETAVAARFSPVFEADPISGGKAPLYDRNNRRLLGSMISDGIFKKRSSSDGDTNASP